MSRPAFILEQSSGLKVARRCLVNPVALHSCSNVGTHRAASTAIRTEELYGSLGVNNR